MIKTDEFVTGSIRLYYDIDLPEDGDGPAPLLIAVHGYAAHKRYMMREAKLVAPAGFAIVSVQGPNRFFYEGKDGNYKTLFGWLTDYKPEESVEIHQRAILDIIERLSSDGTVDKDRVYLYGFSQSCALNFRFAFTHTDVLSGVIGVCGGIPSDLDTNEVYAPTDADVLYLYSTRDEFYPLDKFLGFSNRLEEYLENYRSREYDAAHEISDDMRADIRGWLAER